MSVTTRYETIAVGDDRFDAYCAVPESGAGPGILLFQEIFGINDNMRALAGRLAGEGYLTLVPDMFWRIERRFARNDESGLEDAFAVVQKFDFAQAATDIEAAHAHLLAMPECTGSVGALGFCLGGGLAFLAATKSRPDGRGPDAAVCYYGSAINGMLGDVSGLECPAAFHYGNDDAYIPPASIDEVERAVSGRPAVEFYRYDGAGHAFSNWDAPSMYQAEASDVAWRRTIDFLGRHLPSHSSAD
jgi:carboxymethylenebutenolidase